MGGASGTDMATGRGVDARNSGSGNLNNVNDVNNSASDYMNRSTGFQTLQQVFLATDDHQNRINEVTYSPTGDTEVQGSYVKVPGCFSIVCGPLGATGPETITDHSFANIKAIADSLASAQSSAGIEPIGLQGYPGLHDAERPLTARQKGATSW